MSIVCATLSLEDLLMAGTMGTMNLYRNMVMERSRDHDGFSHRKWRTRWGDLCFGNLGEIAVARTLSLPWTPSTGLYIKHGDIANKLEVRATEHEDGHLLVYPSDPVDHPMLLVVGTYPHFVIAGGLSRVVHGKEKRWWRDDSRPPAWWVPQESLLPPEEVIEAAIFLL